MLHAFRFAVMSSCLVLVACVGAPTRDEQLAKQLVGRWSDVRTLECCDRVEEAIELSEDGTFRTVGVRRGARGSFRYSFSGTWKVDAGDLRYTVTSAEPQEFRKVGEQLSDRIVSVGESEWVMVEQGSGRESRAWRYPK